MTSANFLALKNLDGKRIDESNPFYEKILEECSDIKCYYQDYVSRMSNEKFDKYYEHFDEMIERDSEFKKMLNKMFNL